MLLFFVCFPYLYSVLGFLTWIWGKFFCILSLTLLWWSQWVDFNSFFAKQYIQSVSLDWLIVNKGSQVLIEKLMLLINRLLLILFLRVAQIWRTLLLGQSTLVCGLLTVNVECIIWWLPFAWIVEIIPSCQNILSLRPVKLHILTYKLVYAWLFELTKASWIRFRMSLAALALIPVFEKRVSWQILLLLLDTRVSKSTGTSGFRLELFLHFVDIQHKEGLFLIHFWLSHLKLLVYLLVVRRPLEFLLLNSFEIVDINLTHASISESTPIENISFHLVQLYWLFDFTNFEYFGLVYYLLFVSLIIFSIENL